MNDIKGSWLMMWTSSCSHFTLLIFVHYPMRAIWLGVWGHICILGGLTSGLWVIEASFLAGKGSDDSKKSIRYVRQFEFILHVNYNKRAAVRKPRNPITLNKQSELTYCQSCKKQLECLHQTNLLLNL